MLNSISIIPHSHHELTSSDESIDLNAISSLNGTPAHGHSAQTLMMKASSFFTELRRRKVYRVAVVYAIVSWLLIQAASIFLPTFDAPPGVMRAVVVLLALGFVLSAILSWVFDITPQGIKRTADMSPDESVGIVQQLEAQVRQEFVRGYLSALIHARLGDKTKAIDYLEHEYLDHGYRKHHNIDSNHMSVDAMLDELRGDPRFRPFAERTQ
jgi:hypothetical protein